MIKLSRWDFYTSTLLTLRKGKIAEHQDHGSKHSISFTPPVGYFFFQLKISLLCKMIKALMEILFENKLTEHSSQILLVNEFTG